MSAYLGGLAIIRCAEHERASEIDPTMRLTLAAMATFAGDGDEPRCYAARASIAAKAGLSVTAVRRALLRLEKIGAIEHGDRRGKTVNWRLTLLVGSRRLQGDPPYGRQTPTSDNRAPDAHKNRAPDAHKNRAPETHNPSDPSTSKERERKIGDPLSRPPTANAGAAADTSNGQPSSLSTSSNGNADDQPSNLVAEVMAARGGSVAAAEKWIERRLQAATTPPRNEVAFIRACLAREAAGPAPAARTKAKPAKKATVRTAREANGGQTVSAAVKAPKVQKAAPNRHLTLMDSQGGTTRKLWANLDNAQKLTESGAVYGVLVRDLGMGDQVRLRPDDPWLSIVGW